jgi:hypothetical protein
MAYRAKARSVFLFGFAKNERDKWMTMTDHAVRYREGLVRGGR